MSVLNPPLNITEEDGSPKAWPYKAKFANGTVTDNGDGTVSIAGGGGGGPETDPVFTAWNVPDVAYLTPGTAAATYEPLLPATPENPETKFLNGNKEWKPIAIGAGGFAGNLYFTTIDSDVAGYKTFSYSAEPTETTLTVTLTNTEVLARTYLFESPLELDEISAGLWIASYRVKVSGTPGVTQLKFEAFLRHTDDTETTLFSSYSPELNNTDYVTIRSESTQPLFDVDPTDRLGVRIYVKTTHLAPITVSTIIGDGNGSYFTTPLRIRHNQLRAWNEDPDYQHIDAADRTNLDNLSGTNSGDQLTYKTIAVAGQSDVVAASGTDTLTLAAGSNITLTTDAVNRKVTITSAGGAGIGVATLNGLSGDLTIAGTTNRITVTPAGSAITLSTPQDINTTATPRFARLGLGVAAHATNQITGTGFNFSSLGQLTSSPVMTSAGYGLTLTPTFDNGSAAFQGLRVVVTDTASTAGSRVFYFGVGTNTFQMTSVGGALMQNLTLDTASTLSGFAQTITWNNASYTYNAFLASITDTASGAASNIFRGVVGGVEKFAVRKDGRIIAPFYQFIGGTVSVFNSAADNTRATLGGAFTFNNSAYTYHGVQVNLTNTASGSASSLIYLYVDSALRMRQYVDGRLYVETGTITTNLYTAPVIRFSTTINQSGFTYHSFDINSTHTASAVGSTLFRVLDGTDAKLTVNKFGSVICNSAALATNATDGFLYIPTTTGTPSGTPRAYTGRVAMHYDTANNKLWIYNGAWRSVALA